MIIGAGSTVNGMKIMHLRLATDRDSIQSPPRSMSPCFDKLGRLKQGCHFRGLNLIPNDLESDRNPMKCFICCSTNHPKARCSNQDQHRGLRFCFSCGRIYRTVANCERCKDAPARHQMSLGDQIPDFPPGRFLSWTWVKV